MSTPRIARAGIVVAVMLASAGNGFPSQTPSPRSAPPPPSSRPDPPDARAAAPPGPGLGVPATADEIAAMDVSIGPDGAGLPPGSGTPQQGAEIYAERCAACHGPDGTGGANDRLAGGQGSLATAAPLKTIGSYWPYATTVFDYVRRAMPYPAPHSLTDDEVYALTAHLLRLNGVIGPDAVMDATSLPRVQMPNRDGFRRD
jgi:S-disulfanyl-L-cysteine oxidoreductase SoxD